jgi:Domain of unknown function (DUF4942)
MHSLITQLQDADQDHEFYPTTDEIISAIKKDIVAVCEGDYEHRYHRQRSLYSLLDIGAGNGKVLKALQHCGKDKEGDNIITFQELYAIEKSQILCAQLNQDIMVVGTEFEEQSLFSKVVDVIFCNPPYSQYEQWTTKIIRQSAAPLLYLVIPQRWQENTPIADALRFRKAETTILGSYDFEKADRKARAKIHLLRIEMRADKDDAFDRFFAEEFADLIAKFKDPGEEMDAYDRLCRSTQRKKEFADLVVGETYPQALVNLYHLEMEKVRRNYQLVSGLDADLLKELEISPEKIMKFLKERLSSLRLTYWNELFSRISAITSRLTVKSRSDLLGRLQRHVHVDFTVSNIHAIIVWVIKNANSYLDSQLISTYELMVDKANVHLYKSNVRPFVQDRWRYQRDENSHFLLDWRIVMHSCGGISYSSYEFERRESNGLDKRAYTFLQDLLTIANNLGFHCSTHPYQLSRGSYQWQSNGSEKFFFNPGHDREPELLFEAKAFKNGNLHLRLAKKFILALNVEHGRLRGWIRTPAEAADEMNDIQAADLFKVHQHIPLGSGSVFPLLAA